MRLSSVRKMKLYSSSIQLMILVASIESTCCIKGSFPTPTEIGLHKPIETTAEVTCGTGEGASYCEPATDAYGLTGKACNARACNNECPGRDRNKDGQLRYINVMDGNLRNCIIPKYDDTRGTRMPSYDFRNHPSCFAQPTTVLRTGTSPGQFTLTVWIKQSYRNAGVILEKAASPRPGLPRQIVLSFMVGAFSLVLQYRGLDGRPHFKMLKAPFPPGKWHHLALQVYNQSVSVFIDGIASDDTPFLTEDLASAIDDINYSPVVKVGQRMQATGQFVGRLHDYRWYDQALTNREIQEIYSGRFKELNIQSNCLCPRGYPRVHPIQERYCIANGEPDTTGNRRLRLDEDAHPLAYANDGDLSTVWISSIFYMPGGIMMIIDLENGEYQVFQIELKFYSPQPQAITISRLSNKTTEESWKEWGYFADDCVLRFGVVKNGPLPEPDSFSCIQFEEEEEIPYSGNNITFNLLSEEPLRPGKDDFYNTPELMRFVMAEKIQFRMQYQYFTAASDVHLGHQRYAIKEVKIVGRCNCHGHAETCDMTTNPYKCDCLARSNTDGVLCDRCLPLYNKKPFRMGTNEEAYDCKPCECHKHADSCHYDKTLDPFPNDFFKGGGGRCDDCKHHTTGINCDQCADLYFRLEDASLDDPEVCLSCDCHPSGTVNGSLECQKIDGQCSCKSKVIGRTCSICVDGYYALELDDYDGCKPCSCDLAGTVERDFRCKQEGGQCKCKQYVQSRTCSECQFGYKNLRDSNIFGCEPCNCNNLGARDQFCNSMTGNCFCKPHVQGMHCDECENGYWRLSAEGCQACECEPSGTVPGTVCDKVAGQCKCKANTEGRACDRCKDKYFNLDFNNPQGCENCHCDPRGTKEGSLICDKESGQCECKVNVKARVCNECKGNTFGLDWSLDDGCQACNCDPSGTLLGDQVGPNDLVCHANTGQCACLPSREGRRCNMCSSGYYIPPSGDSGCLDCDCHPYASTSYECNNATGQCPCKGPETGLQGRRCDECSDSFWNFHDLFGECEKCSCDMRGALNDTCNVISGICACKRNVIGSKCDECKAGSSNLTHDNPLGCYSYPEQQAPPSEVNMSSTWIELSWNPPDLPNGDVLKYKLYRNGETIYEKDDKSPFQTIHYNDTSLLPFTNYDYDIETSNVGGSTFSTVLSLRTISGIPTGIPPLVVSDIKATSASFTWNEPDVAHGPIEKYVLQSVDAVNFQHPKTHYVGLETSVKIDDLHAFMNYTFTLRACTSGGCGDSMPLVMKTPEAKPKQQRPPVITPISNTSLHVEWAPPDESNGVILQYELLMRGKPDVDGVHQPLQKVIFRTYGYYNPRPAPDTYVPLDEPETNFTAHGLQPFTEYQFLVLSANSIGSTESTWVTGRTLEGSPLFIEKPQAWAVSSSQVNITWKEPDPISEVRGEVKMYQVTMIKNSTNPYAPPTLNVVLYSTGPKNLHFMASHLDPYVSYVFFVSMCNSVSCVESARVTARTLPAAPEGQGPPTQVDQGNTSISISWEFPLKINGPQPRFTLYRSPVAFSSPPTEMSKGIRFPGASFLKFAPDIIPHDASYGGIRLWFKTLQKNALIFFTSSALASDYTRHEYMVIHLKNGRPWFLFDLQNSPSSITIDNDDHDTTYNDGKWHRLEVNRFERDAYIELDTIYTGSGASAQSATVFGKNEGVFIGGLPHNYNIARPHDRGTNVVVTQNFVGCLKDIAVQRDGPLGKWSNVTFEESEEVYRTYDQWQGCPDILETPSAYFLGKGYLEIKDRVNIKNLRNWSVKMQIRLGFFSGILFYAAGKSRSFIMGTVNNGTLRFIVSLDKENFYDFSLNPETLSVPVDLCDGNWHSVEFYNKEQILGIQLDGNDEIGPQLGLQYSAMDLSTKFYLGGIDDRLMGASSFLLAYFDEDGRSFGGCMKNVNINFEEIDLVSRSSTSYNVDLDGCPLRARNGHQLSSLRAYHGNSGSGSGFGSGNLSPANVDNLETENTCLDMSLQTIYEGDGLEHNDTGLVPFTQYLYRVVSSNDGGDTRSTWKIARSGEGAPVMVSSPYNERHISGQIVQVNWRKPRLSSGVIVNYTLTAYELDEYGQGDGSVLHNLYHGGTFIGNVTGLRPWTRYKVYLTACTSAGCGESTAHLSFTTKQEAPHGVKRPSASITMDSMKLYWNEPTEPNGIIVNYTLFHNNSNIYSSVELEHTIYSLATFQLQEFRVVACTINGCNSSDVATFYSAQMPPSHVDPPMLTILGPHSVEVRWLEPAILNGVFERYVIYLSDNESDPGVPVYNSTNPELEYTLQDLFAGMRYFVSLDACTGGGCRRSSKVATYTTESIPQEIPVPTAISRSPFSFDVSWTEPVRPNGVVLNYSLYFDEELKVTTDSPSSIHMDMLTPYSLHTFRVQACTIKGCASSALTANRTQEAKPEGEIVLSVTIVDSQSLDIMWNMPVLQNGEMRYAVLCTGIYFTDSEAKDYREVHETRILHVGNTAEEWIHVEGLRPYTDYVVQVNASNSISYILSNMRTIVMPPGAPVGVKEPTLNAISSDSILCTWQDPVRNNAPGVAMFQLRYRRVSPLGGETDAFDARTRQMSYILENLQPHEEYEFQLTAYNGFGSTSSAWVSVHTQESSPQSVKMPKVTYVDAWSLQLRWHKPGKPNGMIGNYTIFQSGTVIATVGADVMQYQVEDLYPFTWYTYIIEACTRKGCTRSSPTTVQTDAAAPENLAPPEARAESPTSVFLTWTPPEVENGILDNYILERKSNQSLMEQPDDTTVLGSFVPSQSLRYLDDSGSLMPYTAYQYRVTSTTIGGGSTTSNWTTIVTRPGRPGGILAPEVTVSSARSAYVQWTAPIETNGPMIRYEVLFPDPRIVITDVNRRSCNVTNLIPYTEYQVSVISCTDGGCTESPNVVIVTHTSVPDGVDPPTVAAISESYVSIQWNPPKYPNGPGIFYELTRTKKAQPLASVKPVDMEVPVTIYKGTDLSYQDREIQKFTKVSYVISVLNVEGSVSSNASTVTTLGGVPIRPPDPHVVASNHTSIEVEWDRPSVNDLQGDVYYYVIAYALSNGTKDVLTLSPNKTNIILIDLRPGTYYSITLTANNGAHNITSSVITALTDDGAPDGVYPPVAFSLSASELHVSWLKPQHPNGEIKNFTIVLNGNEIDKTFKNPDSHVISELIPFTVYDLQLKACTKYACTFSDAIQVTTQETVPKSMKRPSIKILGPKRIKLNWQQPAEPNGILKTYRIQRRARMPCKKMSVIASQTEKCRYVHCNKKEMLCGNHCYRPSQEECCDGRLFSKSVGYKCCGNQYIMTNGNLTDVCCSGRFYTSMKDYHCCGTRYIQVLLGEVCCEDVHEDRVLVGAGDSCCGIVPFYSDGIQICCNNILHSGYHAQCCGKKIIGQDEICCGELDAKAHVRKPDHICCGNEYIHDHSAICCHDDASRKAKVHAFTSSHNFHKKTRCCATELISVDEKCCNGIGYDPDSHVCADVGTSSFDPSESFRCGSGVVCAMSQARTAFCDRCNFDRRTFDCLISLNDFTQAKEVSDDEGNCATAFQTIHTGTSDLLNYLDDTVSPFTEYQYKVVASNKVGSVESDLISGKTRQDIPTGIYSPSWKSKSPDSILLSWKAPEQPNGIITEYALVRDGLEIWNGLLLEHTDTFQILPFKQYAYKLKTCTHVGCGYSAHIFATSVQGVPEELDPPVLKVLSPHKISISWIPPLLTNGIIKKYLLNETDIGTVNLVEADANANNFTFIHNDLQPYSAHEYSIMACTIAGCATSNQVAAITLESQPQGVWTHPGVISTNKTTVETYWDAPEKPNGVIREYRLLRRDVTEEVLPESNENLIPVYQGGPERLNYTDTQLKPGRMYQYRLVAVNGAGFGMSEFQQVKMPMYVPSHVPVLDVRVTGPQTLFVQWSLTDEVETPYRYSVIIQKTLPRSESARIGSRFRRNTNDADVSENDDVAEIPLVYSAGMNQTYVIEKLSPYTLYRVRVRTCLANETEDVSCITGEEKYALTMPASPQDQPAPTLKPMGPGIVDVSWMPPKKPNGILTQYQVHRREASQRGQTEKAIFSSGDMDRMWFTDDDDELKPYTKYQYQVRVKNSKGMAYSPWTEVTTLQDTPSGISLPSLTAISAFSVRVRWNKPRMPNGNIMSYSLEYRKKLADPTAKNTEMEALTVPSTLHEAVISGLMPFTPYEVRLVVVNSEEMEARTDWVFVKTSPAAPRNISDISVVKIEDGRSLLLTWDPPSVPNGEITHYSVFENGYDEPLYSGLFRQFLFRRLKPYTNYTVLLEVCTGLNLCTRSGPKTYTTAETAPDMQPAPTVGMANATSIMLTWTRPRDLNGVLISYDIIRTKMPRPFHHSLSSRRRRSVTKTEARVQFMAVEPMSWTANFDGLIDLPHHVIRRNIPDTNDVSNESIIYGVQNPTLDEYNYTDSDLEPYTPYQYKIRSSTKAGYTDSDWVMAETHQAAPAGLNPPTILHTSDRIPQSLVVRWDLPEKINGILQTFRVQRNASNPLSFPATQFQFTDTELKAYTVYSYTVTACTAGGCTKSTIATKRTLEEAPLYVSPPVIVSKTSVTMHLEWEKPMIANGVIKYYKISVDGTVRYEGSDMSTIITGLQPYRLYSMNLSACTASGCRSSEKKVGRTSEAPPEIFPVPELHVTSPHSIEVIWDKPIEPNGRITTYELRRNNELITVTTGDLTRYHDFGLKPGTIYTYTVTAYNIKGSVESDKATEMTDPAAPSGLEAPVLTAVSASSIHATWYTPTNPNGVIMNYTLYVRLVENRNDEKVFKLPGNEQEYTVRGLKYYNRYSFWLQCCTLLGCVMSERIQERTLEGIPSQQKPPDVSLIYPDDVLLFVGWSPPVYPNGVISLYKLVRRRIIETLSTTETTKGSIVYNGSSRSLTDSALLPYTKYQYKVFAANSAGETASDWSLPTRTGEAAPGKMEAPAFGAVTERSIQIFASEPVQPNGVVRSYTVYARKNASAEQFEQMTTGIGRDQTVMGLLPFQTYQFKVKACTLENMCSFSSPALVMTLPAPPRGQGPPQAFNISSTGISLRWNEPTESNGIISSYEVQMRRSCPLPYQAFELKCIPGPSTISYVGNLRETTIENLTPYRSYEFFVISVNDYGRSKSERTSVITLKTWPQFVSSITVTSNISSVLIVWANSFQLNGILVQYELYDDKKILYNGFGTAYNLKRTAAMVHKFLVEVTTDVGTAVSDLVMHDTSKGNSVLTDYDPESSLPDISTAQMPVHETVWFIAVAALMSIMIIFAVLAIVLRRISQTGVEDSKTKTAKSHLSPHAFSRSHSVQRHNADFTHFKQPSHLSLPTSSDRSMNHDIGLDDGDQSFEQSWRMGYMPDDPGDHMQGEFVPRREKTSFVDTHL